MYVDIDEDIKFDRDNYANNTLGNILVKIQAYLFQLFKINDPKVIILISNTLFKIHYINVYIKK